MNRIGTVATLAAAGVFSAGCGGDGITLSRIDASVGVTFANLYTLQQHDFGRPAVTATSISAHADCKKGGPQTPDRGPGNNWICVVQYSPDGLTSTITSYDVSVRSDGCYAATGTAADVGAQSVTLPDGRSVTNPLYEFYGCFDAT